MREKRLQNQKVASPLKEVEGKAAFLAHNDIFQHLNFVEIKELERVTTVITCPPGRLIYRPGEIGSSFFLLKSGQVQIYHLSTDGRKLITATLEAGACFGEMALIGPGVHNSFAEVIKEARIYTMARHDIESILSNKSAVTFALLQLVGQRLTQLEDQLIDTTFKGATARLATLLLQLAHPQENGAHELVVEGLSHEELADRLGIYRETVSASLRELKDAGAIEPGRRRITICKQTLLAGLAASQGKGGTNKDHS